MIDRFKFRLWSNEHKMYIEDNCYPIGGDYHLTMTKYGYVEVVGFGDYLEEDDDIRSWGRVKDLKDYIGDCIIEQCTGLKDKNGKLIYENDLITRSLKIYRVDWCGDKLGFVLRNENNPDDTLESLDITIKTWEIIGTVHENKELLDD